MSRPTAAEALLGIRYRPTGVGLMTTDDDGPWCRFGIAQAALDKLTSERDEARAEVHDVRAAFEGARAIIAALKASPAVNVDETMRLAEKMMRDSWATGEDSAWHPAREALRAYLGGKP